MLEIKRKVYDDKDWYEEYIQVLKDGKEIHYGESFDLPKYENGNYIFYLNYGNIEYYKFFKIYLKKWEDKIYFIPKYNFCYEKVYGYSPLEFFENEIKEILENKEEISKIKKLTIKDILCEWACNSHFREFCNSFEDYQKKLINEIYFVDNEIINNDISGKFEKIFGMKNKKIEKINVEEVEKLDKISVYLENGKVWEAFFKKNEKIYLNTEISVSFEMNEIL